MGSSGVEYADWTGALWRKSSGEVRRRVYRELTPSGTHPHTLSAMYLESDRPANPGDSGGPVVNARGELVGLVCLGDPSRGISSDIDLVEIKSFLKKYALQEGFVWSALEGE